MLYSHRYRITTQIEHEKFAAIVSDFKKIVRPLRHLGVAIAGSNGKGSPEIGPERIRFNGQAACRHPKAELGIVQPSNNAAGVLIYEDVNDLLKVAHEGEQGLILEKRACDGDCSNETFSLVQDIQTDGVPAQIKDGMYLELVRTSYKPYDLAVNICLIIAKHHLGENIRISSDGDIGRWKDGIQVCEHFLEYGSEFELDA